ncbi:MAG: DUF1844 domain-containing protein [Thermodesulfobacteriota bacterium]
MTEEEKKVKGPGPDGREGAPGAAGEEPKEKGPVPFPALNFSSFILSLSSSVLINLGVIENPVTKKTEREPETAKQTIELIELLKEKTKGNLTEDESRLLDDILRELRLQYCKATGK